MSSSKSHISVKSTSQICIFQFSICFCISEFLTFPSCCLWNKLCWSFIWNHCCWKFYCLNLIYEMNNCWTASMLVESFSYLFAVSNQIHILNFLLLRSNWLFWQNGDVTFLIHIINKTDKRKSLYHSFRKV